MALDVCSGKMFRLRGSSRFTTEIAHQHQRRYYEISKMRHEIEHVANMNHDAETHQHNSPDLDMGRRKNIDRCYGMRVTLDKLGVYTSVGHGSVGVLAETFFSRSDV